MDPIIKLQVKYRVVSPLDEQYDVFVDWEFFSMSTDLIRLAGREHLTVDVFWKKNWNLNGAIKSEGDSFM